MKELSFFGIGDYDPIFTREIRIQVEREAAKAIKEMSDGSTAT